MNDRTVKKWSVFLEKNMVAFYVVPLLLPDCIQTGNKNEKGV